MLTELRIENFAIIQQLELSLQPGLIIFTGETGAGKSIILDAITAVVGGKADATYLRSGADRALVEGTFRLPAESKPRRSTKSSSARICWTTPTTSPSAAKSAAKGAALPASTGARVNLSLLRELGSFLVDIHGQSEHLSLLNVRQHLGLLDRYAAVQAALDAYRAAYHALQAVRRELNELRQAEQDADRRTDMLTFQVEEIESAAPASPARKKNCARSATAWPMPKTWPPLAQEALTLLDEGTPEAPAATDLLGQAGPAAGGTRPRSTPASKTLAEQAGSAAETLADLARDLRDYLEGIEFNPHRLEQVEERLDLIHRLQRKYGGSIEAVLAFAEDARQELETITNAAERIAELEAARKPPAGEAVRAGARALSSSASRPPRTLSQASRRELDDLSMAAARFAVDFQTKPDPQRRCPCRTAARVAFDANRLRPGGVPDRAQPGRRAQTAGEDRLRRRDLAPDAGAEERAGARRSDPHPDLRRDRPGHRRACRRGGRRKAVAAWAARHQVLCITHLPQLAAFGDQHSSVRKLVEDGRTTTQVERLDDPARLDELAQMLGSLSEANRTAARETLSAARKRASQLNQSTG